MDVLLGRPGWTKAERDTLRDLLCDAAGELLHASEDDAALKALFAKHAEVDFDTERQQMVRAMKNMTEAMTGLDLGDDEGIHTDADLFERMQQGLQERAAADEAERDAKSARRRKSAAQQRREAEAHQATQSVREIFRKLASALHPDRETDEQQRKIKTALMQKVNQAYAADDLLTLLELQLQIEQLAELRAEIERLGTGFAIDFGLEAGWGMNPRKLGQLLDQSGLELRGELSQQQRDMRMLADVAATKRWLKRQRQLMHEAEFDFELF